VNAVKPTGMRQHCNIDKVKVRRKVRAETCGPLPPSLTHTRKVQEQGQQMCSAKSRTDAGRTDARTVAGALVTLCARAPSLTQWYLPVRGNCQNAKKWREH